MPLDKYQNSLEMMVSECCLEGDKDEEKGGQAKRRQEITNNILIAAIKKKIEHHRYLLEHVYSMYGADGAAKLSQDMLVPCRS